MLHRLLFMIWKAHTTIEYILEPIANWQDSVQNIGLVFPFNLGSFSINTAISKVVHLPGIVPYQHHQGWPVKVQTIPLVFQKSNTICDLSDVVCFHLVRKICPSWDCRHEPLEIRSTLTLYKRQFVTTRYKDVTNFTQKLKNVSRKLKKC